MDCGGFIRSLQFTGLNALAYADIGEAEMSGASTFSAMMQQFSLSVGAGTAAMARCHARTSSSCRLSQSRALATSGREARSSMVRSTPGA